MSLLDFKDKVVVITGAGRGIGRAYAHAFASRGAKVVVNDLGVGVTGEQKGEKVADIVVKELNEKYGNVAVADYHGVDTDGDKIIATAVEKFGKVEILINNAGIVRDKSFSKMTEEEWDIIYRVHLLGAFKVTKAAWDLMKNQMFGRIIFTGSVAGLYGNFGQTNYSAMKEALCGFCRSLALEGERYNVYSNVICPIAATRILETSNAFPSAYSQIINTEQIPPLVLYLCHADTTHNGQTFEVGGGYITRVRYQRAKGVIVSPSENTPEFIAANAKKIFEDFEHSFSPERADDAYKPILKQIITNQLKQQKQGVTKNEAQSVRVEGFKSSSFFEEINSALQDSKTRDEIVNEYKAVYEFQVSNPESQKTQVWTIDLKNKDTAGVYVGGKSSPDCTMIMTDAVCNDVMSGKLSPFTAFTSQKLKIKGGITLAAKLQGLRKYQKAGLPSKL
jgi:3-hydroxyacyl-CoA dehydrogenase/3a,7a,12a-trihydroxy-5b-cholest-24-enoyl-CoA hydratase